MAEAQVCNEMQPREPEAQRPWRVFLHWKKSNGTKGFSRQTICFCSSPDGDKWFIQWPAKHSLKVPAFVQTVSNIVLSDGSVLQTIWCTKEYGATGFHKSGGPQSALQETWPVFGVMCLFIYRRKIRKQDARYQRDLPLPRATFLGTKVDKLNRWKYIVVNVEEKPGLLYLSGFFNLRLLHVALLMFLIRTQH